MNYQETKIQLKSDDLDCTVVNISSHLNVLRSPPCTYSPKYRQYGGRPWYWDENVKTLRWTLFYGIN